MARPTGDAYVDSILYGTDHWGLDELAFFFDNSYDNWTFGAKKAFRSALETWSDVAAIDFREVFISAAADLIESYVDDSTMTNLIGGGTLGAHETPWSSDHTDWLQGWYNWETFGWPERSGYDADSLDAGGLARSTFIHEIGHALGLAHPHDNDGKTVRMPGVSAEDDLGTHEFNQGVFTVMTYNDGWTEQDPWGSGVNDRGYNAGPGSFDIAAIQFLYGADTANKGGGSTYELAPDMGWSAIWDTGGSDTISYGGNKDAVINLNSAALDESANAGGYLSYLKGGSSYGGYTIAGDFTDALADKGGEVGVIIENATGGSGDDRIIGNGVANVLKGNGGSDKVTAGSGKDKVLGGNGSDELFGGSDNDILRGENGADAVSGGTGNDKVDGGGGDDVVKGKAGEDTVIGGKGDDILRGGTGGDIFVFRNGWGFDEVRDFKNDVDTLKLDDALWGGGWTAQQVVDNIAKDKGDYLVLKFGNGDKITLLGIDATADLVDDLLIV